MSASCESHELVVLLNATISSLEASILELTPADPCAASSITYDRSLHIGAIFIILVASLAGVFLTVAGKHFPRLRISPFTIVLGKTAGTGIVLSVSLVHMLVPASESLTSPCAGDFSKEYSAYAQLTAVLSALAMQTIDTFVRSAIDARADAPEVVCTTVDCPEEPAVAAATSDDASDEAVSESSVAASASGPSGESVLATRQPVPHKHAHLSASDAMTAVLSAVFAELGFTIHSVLIGLVVGVTGDSELRSLLIALCFHQFFEGVTLGARLAEAPMSAVADVAFAVVFALSAPVGIATGVGFMARASFSTTTAEFLLVQGIFDAICAGMLLFIGFQMLIIELPKDLKLHAAPREKGATRRRLAVFAALWSGAGVMSLLGRWL